ncbi:hypothetical protein ABMA28_014497 [Loxostege sticticalis]|uniref:FP protein C-terminal domain-containing protein n=1 Tax=Loxostege sticticalis TaxID=481309 RepID=A0ABD0TH07_LOXSC
MTESLHFVKTGSAPELHLLDCCDSDLDNVNINQRKRKRMEDDIHMLFEQFSSKFSAKLLDFKNELESKITDVRTDINSVIKSDLDSIKTKLTTIEVNQSQLFADMESMKSAINFQDNAQKELVKRVDRVCETSGTQGSDIARMQTQIRKLEFELNDQQQRDRAFNLELTGVPERPKEDLTAYYCSIVKYLDVPSSASDIVHITRVRPINPVPGRPKAIVLKLNSRPLRDSILSAARAKKGFQTSDIGIPGESKKIFVNEHLTPSNKLLHKNTREKARAAQFRFVWVRDGKIFARKNETSPTIRIMDSSDLRKIV